LNSSEFVELHHYGISFCREKKEKFRAKTCLEGDEEPNPQGMHSPATAGGASSVVLIPKRS